MSIIVQTVGEKRASIGLAGALRWSVLANSDAELKKKNAAIRNQASLIGAKSYVTMSLDSATFLGQYTEVATGAKKVKVLHSLAIAFNAALQSEGVDSRTVNAILLREPAGSPDNRELVVIEGGQVVRDAIENTAEAIGNVQRSRDSLPDHIVYAQHPEVSNAEEITWDMLFEHCSKATTLVPVPGNPATMVGAGVVVLAVAGFFAYQQLILKPRQERERRAAAAALDQTPVYLSQLRASLGAVGWERADLTKNLAELSAFPFYSAGWALEKRKCSALIKACDSQWKRTGGQLSSLIALLPKDVYDVALSNLDIAIMAQQKEIPAASMDPDNLIKMDDAARQLREVLQKLANAEVGITTGNAEKWPSMNFANVTPGVIASRAAIEISAPLPRIIPVLASLPANVVVDSYELTVSAGDIGTIFKVTLKGFVYAK